MANLYSRQLIVDGPRNTVVKVAGVLDTSDIAATGNIGASGFTTAVGSKVITFVAGALVPMVGQYLTFSDGTTTFPAGTYVTSVDSATQVTVNNAAKVLNAAAAVTITGAAGGMVIADPLELAGYDNTGLLKAAKLSLLKVVFTVEDGLEVRLAWDATVPLVFDYLTGRTKTDYNDISGLPNNAGAGVNGRVLLSTEGWAATKIYSFTVTCYFKKQQT